MCRTVLVFIMRWRRIRIAGRMDATIHSTVDDIPAWIGRTNDWEKGKGDAIQFDPVDWYEILREGERVEGLIQGHWQVMGEFDREHRVGALARQLDRMRAPHPAGRTGDEGDVTVEGCHRHSPFGS